MFVESLSLSLCRRSFLSFSGLALLSDCAPPQGEEQGTDPLPE